jgi:hypothetical protein
MARRNVSNSTRVHFNIFRTPEKGNQVQDTLFRAHIVQQTSAKWLKHSMSALIPLILVLPHREMSGGGGTPTRIALPS